MAWETTTDDVQLVLRRNDCEGTDKEVSDIHDKLDMDAVESAALSETDFIAQVDAAHDEIERQLRDMGIIP